MANISFTWELGGGLGHLVRYRSLIAQLCAAGHTVDFFARESDRARTVFAGTPVAIHDAPYDLTAADRIIPAANSFPEVLLNSGFADSAALLRRLRRWRKLLSEAAPDVVVADYSPSAVLACRLLGLRCVVSGNGFYVPPRQTPLPPFRYWLATDRQRLAHHEAQLLDHMNSALRALDGEPATNVTSALLTDETFLHAFEEFDHCYERPAARYLGAYPSLDFGAAPVWPSGEGPRVFAYLAPVSFVVPFGVRGQYT